MKKMGLVLMCLLVILLGGCSLSLSNDSYLRVHIRANSNSAQDQSIKYEVKNLCVEYLSEYVVDCKSKQDVINVLNQKNEQLTSLINEYLLSKGFCYGCNISINNEFFPTRTYGDLTLKQDYYDALIINLGSGKGDNWWCVVYPALCFNNNTNVVYKSKIKEILSKI